MAKKSHIRRVIKGIMVKLGFESQAQFAQFLKLRPTTVSAWFTGASLPSPDAYVTLAMIAEDKRDALLLLQEAGLSLDRVVSLAAAIGSDRFRPREGGYVRVPRKRRTEAGIEPTGKFAQVASELVRHLERSFVFELREPNAAGENAVLVDTVDDPSLNIKPFLGQLILVDFASKSTVASADSYFSGAHIGYLYVKYGDRKIRGGRPWVIRFCSESDDYTGWEEVVVGEWVELIGWDREAKPIVSQLDVSDFILGRVVAWLRLTE